MIESRSTDMDTQPHEGRALINSLLRPWLMLACVMCYSVGISISIYLGNPVKWATAGLGAAFSILFLVISMQLRLHFEWISFRIFGVIHVDFQNLSERLKIIEKPVFLQAALVSMAIGAVVTVLLWYGGGCTATGWIFLGLGFLLAIFYAVPPLALVNRGYGELVDAVLVVILPPAIALILQTGEMHRMLPIFSFPLTLLYIAMVLALSLKDYGQPNWSKKINLLSRIGWESGMDFHNALIFLAVLVFLIMPFIGFPREIMQNMFLVFIGGLFQGWQMKRICMGSKPNWGVLALTARAIFFISAYLISFSLITQ